MFATYKLLGICYVLKVRFELTFSLFRLNAIFIVFEHRNCKVIMCLVDNIFMQLVKMHVTTFLRSQTVFYLISIIHQVEYIIGSFDITI